MLLFLETELDTKWATITKETQLRRMIRKSTVCRERTRTLSVLIRAISDSSYFIFRFSYSPFHLPTFVFVSLSPSLLFPSGPARGRVFSRDLHRLSRRDCHNLLHRDRHHHWCCDRHRLSLVLVWFVVGVTGAAYPGHRSRMCFKLSL